MSNDELQKAIDDITNNNVAAGADAAVNMAAENEQLANELAGAAPVAAEAAEFAPAPAPMPEVPAEPAMPPMSGAVAADAPAPEMIGGVAPAAEASTMPTAEIKLDNAAVPEAPVSDNATLEEAMRELYPLIDRVEMPIDEKFEITMKYGEPAKALDFAKQMTDENAKAKALLQIIEKLK